MNGPGTGWTPVTVSVFWAVSAVIAVIPWTPQRANAFRSAWIPAPPPESEPAIDRRAGMELGIGPGYDGAVLVAGDRAATAARALPYGGHRGERTGGTGVTGGTGGTGGTGVTGVIGAKCTTCMLFVTRAPVSHRPPRTRHTRGANS